MDFTIDRALPISIRQQLKGLIEYAIACGDAVPGEPLPSVRDLASALGVAPMTVSQVYADLKGLGLIETRAGSGTFVAEGGAEPLRAQEDFAALHGQIDALIDKGLSLGLRTSDLASLIHARLASRARHGRRKSIAVVGLFQPTTARYARLIAEQIGRTATVEPATVDLIQRDPAARSRIASSDLVVTFVNRRREVASLLPGARVSGIRFVPAEETRRALAAIAPGTRLLLVARVPEFLPIMKAGVTRFAASPALLNLTTGSAADVAPLAAAADVVVYASGTEDMLATIPEMLPTIEYRHIPYPLDVQRRIASLLDDDGELPGARSATC